MVITDDINFTLWPHPDWAPTLLLHSIL